MTDFVILDPGLRQRAGHYFEYDMALKDAAVKAGYFVEIYAHADWDEPMEGVIPFFANTVGQGDAVKRAGHAWMTRLPSWLRAVLFTPARWVFRLLRAGRPQSDLSLNDVDQLHLSNTALILCPSVGYADIVATLLICVEHKDRQWRFILRQMPQTKGEQIALDVLREVVIPANVHILTDTESLTNWLKDQGVAARTIPIPMRAPVDIPPPHSTFTFAMLGPARAEKGIALMPDLVRALLPLGARFVIQTTMIGGQSPDPHVEKAIRALRAIDDPNLVLIDGDVSEADFYRLIGEASCLLVPYDRKRYAARSSGLQVQAYLCGRPAIVPSGTWMADQVPDFLSHCVWTEDLTQTCRDVMTKKPDMRDFSAAWRAKHNADAVFSAINQ